MGFPKIKEENIDPTVPFEFKPEDYKGWLESIVWTSIKRFPPNARLDFEEFMSEALLALVESVEKFNPQYNNSLRAWARPYIIKRLSEFMAINLYTLKVRYYNVKNNEAKLAEANLLENTLMTDARSSVGENENPMYSAPSGISTYELVALKEEVDVIKHIVNDNLPVREKRAIVLRFKHGKTYQEIADKIGCCTETARQLVKRGIKKIKERAENVGITGN